MHVEYSARTPVGGDARGRPAIAPNGESVERLNISLRRTKPAGTLTTTKLLRTFSNYCIIETQKELNNHGGIVVQERNRGRTCTRCVISNAGGSWKKEGLTRTGVF